MVVTKRANHIRYGGIGGKHCLTGRPAIESAKAMERRWPIRATEISGAMLLAPGIGRPVDISARPAMLSKP